MDKIRLKEYGGLYETIILAGYDDFQVSTASFEDLRDYLNFIVDKAYCFEVQGSSNRLSSLLDYLLDSELRNRIQVVEIEGSERTDDLVLAIANGKEIARTGLYPIGLPKNQIKHIYCSDTKLLAGLSSRVVDNFGVNHAIYTPDVVDSDGYFNLMQGESDEVDDAQAKQVIKGLETIIQNGQLFYSYDRLPTDLAFTLGVQTLHRLIMTSEGIKFNFEIDSYLAIDTSFSELKRCFSQMKDKFSEESRDFSEGLKGILPILLGIARQAKTKKITCFTPFNGEGGLEQFLSDFPWIGYCLDDGYYVVNLSTQKTFKVDETFMMGFHQVIKGVASDEIDAIKELLYENN